MFEALIAKIGQSKFQRLLGKASIDCQQQYLSLQTLLEQQNWGKAAKQAHTLKGTASLLSRQELVRSLEMIEQGNLDLISQPGFLPQLKQEYLDCLDTMQQWL